MKKIALLAAIISIVVNCLSAQERDQLHFGLKVGANYSNVYDIKGQDFTADNKFGLAAGLFVSIPLGEILGVRPEVLFSQKGYESNGSVLGVGYKITHTANFIDVPILLELKPADFITIVAGPQYSYLISQKNTFSSSLFSGQQQQNFDNTNIRKNILCFIGGIDLNVKPLVIGLRAGWDILHNNGDGTSTSPRYKNVWYQATLGFRF
jgi:hypothetical protein